MKTNKVFVVSIIICLLTMVLPTGISESVNEIENIKSVNDFPPENGPYYVSIFGDLQGCHYPSLFHIGPIWFLPNWEYIELTFKDDVMLWVDGEDYIVNSTIWFERILSSWSFVDNIVSVFQWKYSCTWNLY